MVGVRPPHIRPLRCTPLKFWTAPRFQFRTIGRMHCRSSTSIGKQVTRSCFTVKLDEAVLAMHKVRVCRDDVYPNPTFWKALIRFERELLGSESIPEEAVQDLHAYNWHYFGDGQGGALRKSDSQTEGKQARDLLNELSS
eukprot:g11353.t1